MLADKRFRSTIKKLKDTYTEVGCPIPKDGCKDLQGYLDWQKSYSKVRSELYKSDAYKNAIQKITGGKERISLEELNAKEDFEKSFFPPMYGYVFDDILVEQGLDPKDADFQSFMENHFFFNQKEYSESIFNIKWTRNDDTDKMELFVQILPHTTGEDIKTHFSEIKKDQAYLPKEVIRNRKKIYIERDLWIINEYYRIKAHRKERPRTKRHELSQSIESIIQRNMPKKWGDLSTAYIRTIITRSKTM